MNETNSSPGKKALVVEDHCGTSEVLKMILESDEWQVKCVETGAEALRVLAGRSASGAMNFDPDLMLLDLRLPDMRGVEVIERLQEQQVRIPPTVILSADSLPTLGEAA